MPIETISAAKHSTKQETDPIHDDPTPVKYKASAWGLTTYITPFHLERSEHFSRV